jgi:hypothetical protein
MLHRSKRIWKQTGEYGAIADAFRRKHLKMLENFVVVGGAPYAANGRIYSTNPLGSASGRQPIRQARDGYWAQPAVLAPICRG